jgi:hypothetical protein
MNLEADCRSATLLALRHRQLDAGSDRSVIDFGIEALVQVSHSPSSMELPKDDGLQDTRKTTAATSNHRSLRSLSSRQLCPRRHPAPPRA